MSEMFATLGNWNWLIFGVILMALEVLAPGAKDLDLALSAAISRHRSSWPRVFFI